MVEWNEMGKRSEEGERRGKVKMGEMRTFISFHFEVGCLPSKLERILAVCRCARITAGLSLTGLFLGVQVIEKVDR